MGILELFTAFLLFTPKYRKLGGLLGSALMIFFIAWVAYFYNQLVGKDCGCFPIIKRAVGPGFFVSDAVMLLFGLIAATWGPAVKRLRVPALAFVALAVLAGANFAFGAVQRRNVEMPYPVAVDGKPTDLRTGKVFLFFYDPECMHCDRAARAMATYNWRDTRVVAIPTREQHFAKAFLSDTGLKAGTSLESDRLKKVFPFGDPPYGVALENGHERSPLSRFDENEPAATLRKLGFIE